MPIRRSRIRQLAEVFLEENRIDGPPVPVDTIVRKQGLILRKEPNTDSNISGFLARRGRTALIGVNSNHPVTRQRFTIGHEFGHYLLHSQSFSEIHVDRTFIRFRDEISSQGEDPDEREANLFAAEILMPKRFIEQDLPNVGKVDVDSEQFDQLILKLAKRYNVSTQAMLFRFANLGYIDL